MVNSQEAIQYIPFCVALAEHSQITSQDTLMIPSLKRPCPDNWHGKNGTYRCRLCVEETRV